MKSTRVHFFENFQRGLLLFSMFFVALLLLADRSDAATWARTYGAGDDDEVHSMQVTTDGGYILTGATTSFSSGADDFDLWVLKLKSSGAIAWQKAYGDSSEDSGLDIQQTPDGGYIVSGYMTNPGDLSPDMWLLRLDSLGEIIWQKTYGSAFSDERAIDVEITADGGFIVGGSNLDDALLLRLDANGNILWQKTYGGDNSEYLAEVHQTVDGGFIVAADSYSFSANPDVWIFKLSPSGNIQWQNIYTGVDSESSPNIQQTSDGGYIVSATTNSFGPGLDDAWVLKLDSSGNITWQRTYGFAATSERTFAIEQTPTDGGYILAATIHSLSTGDDVWLIKLDPAGSIIFQEKFGGTNDDSPSDVHQLSSGHGYILSSTTFSFGSGLRDIWLLRLNNNGKIGPQCPENNTASLSHNGSGNAVATFGGPGNANLTVTTTTVTPSVTNANVYQQCGSQHN